MRLVRLIAAALLIVSAASGQGETGSIKGIVVDSITHQPVGKAVVTAKSANSLTATTDAAGVFVIVTPEPGPYHLGVKHPLYPQAHPDGPDVAVMVKSGEETGPVTVELAPGGSVSGRVLDDDGDPLTECAVQVSGSQAGRSVLYLAQADADGVYQIPVMPPGTYRLTARCAGKVFEPRPLSAGPDPPSSSSSMAWQDQPYDAPIVLTPAAVRTGVDFKMRPDFVTHIHVTLSPASEWQGLKPFRWQLLPPAPPYTPAVLYPRSLQGFGIIMTAKGEFDIPEVFPGAYTLVVSAGNGESGAVQVVQVGDQPLRVTVEPHPVADIRGTVEMEDGGAVEDKILIGEVSQVSQQFSAGSPVQDDHTFTIKGVFPGPAWVFVTARHAYMKSAWLGSDEVTGNTIDLSSGVPRDLRIVLSTRTATVRGFARPSSNMSLVSVDFPRQGARSLEADQNGVFAFEGVAPGKYILSQGYEEGREITLAEDQTLIVDLTAQ